MSTGLNELTHWGRVTHIYVSNLTVIGSDNDLSPDRRQAIIWTNAGLLLIGPLGTKFSEILIEILTFSFKKMCLKVSSVKRRPFCLGLNVLTIERLQCLTRCHWSSWIMRFINSHGSFEESMPIFVVTTFFLDGYSVLGHLQAIWGLICAWALYLKVWCSQVLFGPI